MTTYSRITWDSSQQRRGVVVQLQQLRRHLTRRREMREYGPLLCSPDVKGPRGMLWRQFFLWPICSSKGHKWIKEDHWAILFKGLVYCDWCCASQFLEDVPVDWDGTYHSKRLDKTSAVLSGLLMSIWAVAFVAIMVRVF